VKELRERVVERRAAIKRAFDAGRGGGAGRGGRRRSTADSLGGAVTNPQERLEITRACSNLRRLLNSVQPIGAFTILREVGDLECTAMIASKDQLPDSTQRTRRAAETITSARIIDREAH
jgi:hypothetical protein